MYGIKGFMGVVALVLCMVSCSKNDSYSPFHASAIHNGVLLSYTDAAGNDLLASESVAATISVYGEPSEKNIPFEIESIAVNEISRNYLSFNVDLPDINDMVFNEDKSNGKGESMVKLNIGERVLMLKCKFVFRCTDSESLGSNIIQLDTVECNGISKSAKWNSQLIMDLADYID